jgi:hypothetical protein
MKSLTLPFFSACLLLLIAPTQRVCGAPTTFSQYFNNGTGASGDKTAAVYNWNSGIGSSGTLNTGLPAVGVSQGATNTAGVPTITGESTNAGFLYALHGSTAGVSMLFTTNTSTSDVLQDQPQPSWRRNGTETLAGLTVGDIDQLSVYTRPATTATVMRFALSTADGWYVSTASFTQSDLNVYEQRTLDNLTAANSWYSGVFTPGSFLDTDVTGNSTVTLSAASAVTGYGWYADTNAQTGNDQRVRIDSFQITTIPEPGTLVLVGFAVLALSVSRKRSCSLQK